MGDLLKVKMRGAHCDASAVVSGSDMGAVYLLCNLAIGHPGPLHYDAIDEIWWAGGTDE
jgi:hypothetical protein